MSDFRLVLFGLVLCSKVNMLCTFELSDRESDGSNLILIINDRESFIVNMRFEPSNAQFDGSDVRYIILRIPLYNTNPQFVIETWIRIITKSKMDEG